MVLPERTVDLWTASYITKREPRARLWAPTERDPGERYDLVAGLAEIARPAGASDWPNKLFVLENKGVWLEEGVPPRHGIRIGTRQLWEHLRTDVAAGGSLLYYLLPALAPRGKAPDPDWSHFQSARAGQLPALAARRVRSIRGPGFEDWAVIVGVLDLFCYLYERRKLSQDRVELDPHEAWRIKGSVSLKRFLTRVRECQAGRRAESLQRYLARKSAKGWREDSYLEEEALDSVRTFYAVGGKEDVEGAPESA